MAARGRVDDANRFEIFSWSPALPRKADVPSADWGCVSVPDRGGSLGFPEVVAGLSEVAG